jgi:hypothetical protein
MMFVAQKDVSNEPPTSPGSFDTSSTSNFRRKSDSSEDAARGVTECRSSGASLAKPRFEYEICRLESHAKDGGSPLSPFAIKHSKMTALEVSCHVMRGDLDMAIKDLSRCRSLSWLSQEMRQQLGRCLFELHTARRMCL